MCTCPGLVNVGIRLVGMGASVAAMKSAYAIGRHAVAANKSGAKCIFKQSTSVSQVTVRIERQSAINSRNFNQRRGKTKTKGGS
jgi:hypothetical protein